MQRCLASLVLLFLLFGAHPQTTLAQDLDLRGTVAHGTDGYVLVPFEVPADLKRLDISFSYTGREDHTTLDLGLARSTTLPRLERRQQKRLQHRDRGRNALLSARATAGRHVEAAHWRRLPG